MEPVTLMLNFTSNLLPNRELPVLDPAVLGGTGRFCSAGTGRWQNDRRSRCKLSNNTGGGSLATVSFLQWANVGSDAAPNL
jgi:hypothetical protein